MQSPSPVSPLIFKLRGDDPAAEDEEQADDGVGEGYGESWDVPEENPFEVEPGCIPCSDQDPMRDPFRVRVTSDGEAFHPAQGVTSP